MLSCYYHLQSDALKGEDGRPDQERERISVKVHDIGETVFGKDGGFLYTNVYHCHELFGGPKADSSSHPIKINASAINAVPESLAKFRIIANGKKMINSAKMRYRVGMNVLQSVTARMKA